MPTEKTYLVESPSQRAERLKRVAAAVFGEGKENRNRRLRRLGTELVGIRDLVEEGCTLAEFLRSRGTAGLGNIAFVSEFTQTIDAIRTQPAEKSKRARQAVVEVIEVLGEWSGKVGRPGSSAMEIWAACQAVAAYLSQPPDPALPPRQRRRKFADGEGVTVNLFERVLKAGIAAEKRKQEQMIPGSVEAPEILAALRGQGLRTRTRAGREFYVELPPGVTLGFKRLELTAKILNRAIRKPPSGKRS